MTTILGISGSLRKASYNTAVLRAVTELAPGMVRIETAGIHGIPLYDGDVESREGIPQAVAELKDRVAAADGLLLVTPEYNNSIPGPFKNAIDWMSRPPTDSARVFGGKPVALIGASPGRFGTLSAQTAWLPVFRVLGMRPWLEVPMYISAVHKLMDDEHRLTDTDTRERLGKFLAGFAAFIG
jgi:NAD(P)H-dependent FMN reductase